ncbi:MAG: exopolyphosphatase [Saprospiraceae bacterium]|nr:exopolyphosphatase [Saprospiraceae bacterium]
MINEHSTNRMAVIDLGTNTFHILIAEPDGQGGYRHLYRYREFVRLAEDGIHEISPAAFGRALAAVHFMHEKLEEYEVGKIRASGTAALRTAANGPDFIRQVKEMTGIEVQLITGIEEARLIHLGVLQAIPPTLEPMLIMDIGGGSVEFIISEKGQMRWSQSFPVGVAVLYHHYHHHEPILASEVAAVQHFLDQQLAPLHQALSRHPVQQLIGAAGTFDVLESLLATSKPTPNSAVIPLAGFFPLYYQLLNASVEGRHHMEGIPEDRADMIVVAMILIDYVLRMADIRQLTVSSFALKEGMLVEIC